MKDDFIRYMILISLREAIVIILMLDIGTGVH